MKIYDWFSFGFIIFWIISGIISSILFKVKIKKKNFFDWFVVFIFGPVALIHYFIQHVYYKILKNSFTKENHEILFLISCVIWIGINLFLNILKGKF